VKISIFDAIFVLPPMLEMVEVEKEILIYRTAQNNSSNANPCRCRAD
jgi:hypothetical protein